MANGIAYHSALRREYFSSQTHRAAQVSVKLRYVRGYCAVPHAKAATSDRLKEAGVMRVNLLLSGLCPILINTCTVCFLSFTYALVQLQRPFALSSRSPHNSIVPACAFAYIFLVAYVRNPMQCSLQQLGHAIDSSELHNVALQAVHLRLA